MANNTITSIQFKRGNKSALERVLVDANKPSKGEPIWEIDTNKLKIGDGLNNYLDLPYLTGESEESNLVITGYYYSNGFYEEPEHINVLPRYTTKLYFDISTSQIYYYSIDSLYHRLVQTVQVDSNLPGLIKLYSTTGEHIDGTMTQKAITAELNKKVELSLDEVGSECVTFITPSLN